MSTIAVTGATGFVGTALIQELLEHNHEVLIIGPSDYCVTDAKEESVRAALVDHPLFDQYRADALIHLAWAGSAGAARVDAEVQMKNVVMAVEAVKIAARLGAKTFVGVGTITEREVDYVEWTPGVTPSGGFLYGVAKNTANAATKFEAARLGISHIWARLGNAYGAPDHSGRFLVNAVEQFVAGEAPAFTSGTQMFDFVALADAAQGLRLVAEKGASFQEYYIGSGEARPLREFVELARDVAAPGLELSFGGAAQSGVSLAGSAFSIEPLIAATGYSPQIPFEVGVQELAAWVRSKQG
jgi:nucleoside-diphosphate-sugar epimerase